MKNEIYVVVEYDNLADKPTEHILGVFTEKKDADHQVSLINNWADKTCGSLLAKVVVASLDHVYT